MLQKMFLIAVALLLLVLQSFPCKAVQDYFEDTIWTKKTDQLDGFYMLSFNQNDSIFVGHGYGMDIFYETKTGNEIKRIEGNMEVFYINNDENFIRLRQDQKAIEIFDSKTFKVIDTLENDTMGISKFIAVSNDKKYLVSAVTNALRIWDISTRKIILTKYIKPEENLIGWGTGHITFNCDNTKIIAAITKKYYNPGDPYKPIYKGGLYVLDFLTLDSLDELPSRGDFKVSNTCKYIAYKTSDKDYGVEIYNIETKKLVNRLFINGPSLTGMEFSPDDKYIVTSNGPDANCLLYWDLNNGLITYKYLDGSYRNFDITSDGKYIITSIGKHLLFYYAKNGGSAVNEEFKFLKTIYPNPATKKAII